METERVRSQRLDKSEGAKITPSVFLRQKHKYTSIKKTKIFCVYSPNKMIILFIKYNFYSLDEKCL